MSGAARKSKLSKYSVTIKREIEHTAVVEVEARNIEEAKELAVSVADAPKANSWREGDVLSEDIEAKLLR